MFRSLASIYALGLALSVSLLGCAGRAKESVALYEAGDYAGAGRAADAQLAQHPDDDNLLGMRIRASLATGDAASVASHYQRLLDARGGEQDLDLCRELASATLEQALNSPSAKLKLIAIDAVTSAQLTDLAENVAERMEDKDDRVVAAAATAILHAYPQAPKALGAMLESENAEARAIAVEGIGKKVGKIAFDDLEKAANDRDVRVRRIAIRWLGQLKDANAVEILARRAKDPDDSVRAASITALGRIGLGNLPGYAKQAVGDHSLAVRLAGVDLYVDLSRTLKMDTELGALAEDENANVAVEAAIAIKRTDLAQKALDKLVVDDRSEIRAGAANVAIRAVGKEAAKPVLGKLGQDADARVRLSAARAMMHVDMTSAAVDIFGAALATPDTAIGAAEGLVEANDARGAKALDAVLATANTTALDRISAVQALRGTRHITPGLVAALADGNGIVRMEAAAALVTIAKS
ncbi:MAG TPA: HEAT repeat domain-containing protein [Kofleriaceae bacterium]|jgi:HEAT repeat protein